MLGRSLSLDSLIGNTGLGALLHFVLRGGLLLQLEGNGLGVHFVGLRGGAEDPHPQ
jgi:hypothetical protein